MKNETSPIAPLLVVQTALVLLGKAPDDLPPRAYSDLLDQVGSFINDERQNVMTYNFTDNCCVDAFRMAFRGHYNSRSPITCGKSILVHLADHQKEGLYE